MRKVYLSVGLAFLGLHVSAQKMQNTQQFFPEEKKSQVTKSAKEKLNRINSKAQIIWEEDFSEGQGSIPGVPVSFTEGSLTQGVNYVSTEGVATAGGSGSGLTVNVVVEQNDYLLDLESLFGGSGYSTATDVAVTGGAGENMLVDVEATAIGGVSAYDEASLDGGDDYINAVDVATTGGLGTGLTVDITTVEEGPVAGLNDASLSGGDGYADGVDVATTSGGAGTGLTVDIVTDAGAVTAVTINNPGTGYMADELITIDGGTTDATIEVAAISGAIDTVEINNPGVDYEVNDVITIDGGNGTASFTVSEVTNGEIVSVAVSNPGNEEYEVGDVLTITGGDGEATVAIGDFTGPITEVTIDIKGNGYTDGDVVTILDGDESATIQIESIEEGFVWLMDNTSDVSGDWEIGTNPPSGGFSEGMGAIESTTADNNYALFDSDALCSSDCQQNAWMYSVLPIDLSDFPNVIVEFESYYRDFNGQCFVELSTDLENWTTYEVHEDIGVNEASANPELIRVNISSDFGGESEVYLRFRFEGEWGYAWMVDDIKFVEPFDYDLNLSNVDWAMGAYPYGEIPISQLSTISFESTVVNEGANDQLDAVVNLDINGDVISSDEFAISVGETVVTPVVDFNAPQEVASYVVNASVSSSMEDDNPGNTSIENAAMFNVNEFIYARDMGLANFTGGGTALQEGGYDVGNAFVMFAPAEMYGIDVYIREDNTVGEEIYGTLYDITDDFNFHSETEFYTIQEEDLGAFVTLTFPEISVSLDNERIYMPTVGTFGGENSFITATSGTSAPQTTFLYSQAEDTWYFSTRTPMVRMNFDETLSTSEVEKRNFSVKAYPNPAKNQTTIQFELENNADVNLVLTDMSGKVVYSTEQSNVAAGKNQINVSTNGLSNGVYFYSFEANGNQVTEKLIINK